ncbi:MAG: alpha-ketoacid dehydrogenase subunit beta [Planctomycetota bacterium]
MPTETPTATTETTLYIDAISRALRDELRSDPSVLLMGQDIAAYGGAFKITRGFLDEFGDSRIMNTPIAESGTIGIAVGAALLGQRPVVEMQFADFISCGYNQVVNVAAKMYYRTQHAVPLVIRLPAGGGVGAGAFHSQCMEAWFTHTAGLKVVAPAFAIDAYTLLREAIRDPNPVIYLEHKYLYRRQQDVVPAAPPLASAVHAGARVIREGSDVTLVSYGWMVHRCQEAAERLAEDGISVEVIDLRVLAPLDDATVIESVRKTNKVAIVHEAQVTGGFGAEVAARIADQAIDCLDGPIRRLGFPDIPVPFHKELEAAVLPDAAKIMREVRALVAW